MQKVQSGAPLKIPARTYNAFIDAAEGYRRGLMNQSPGSVPADMRTGIITVKNNTGNDYERFTCLGLDQILISAAENEQEFLKRVAFNASQPGDLHQTRFVVLQEPLKTQAFGKAMLFGVSPVLLIRPKDIAFNPQDAAAFVETNFAGLKLDAEDSQILRAGNAGALILWEQPPEEYDAANNEPHWALIRFPMDDGLPRRCRLVLRRGDPDDIDHDGDLSEDLPLTGLYPIDTITPESGDLVLVARDQDTDGVYRVGVGDWVRIAKLRKDSGPTPDDGVPILPRGHQITIWDGFTFPNIYVVGIAYVWENSGPGGFGED